MTRLEAIVAELEAELKADGYDASYYTGIHEAISIITKHLTTPPSKEEIERVSRALFKQHYPNESLFSPDQIVLLESEGSTEWAPIWKSFIPKAIVALQSIFPEGEKV